MQKIAPNQKHDNTAPGGVQSIERALDLLEYLAQSPGWVGISALSSAAGQPVGTTHRILMTLMARNYVIRDSRTRRYALGPTFRRLANAVQRTPNWTEIAGPFLRELVEISGETANLAVLEGDKAVYMAQAQSGRLVRMFTEIGNKAPLHCTGCGKVLLAYQPKSVIDSVLARIELPAFTATTITTPEQLRTALETVRLQGYALDSGEQEEGVRCLSVPVHAEGEEAVAAISISGPSSRLDSTRILALIPDLKQISANISAALAAQHELSEGL
jgi:IclR family transcriptional regulator, acetate operon repressor